MRSILTILSLALLNFASAQESAPNAEQIIEGARLSATLTKLESGLSGSLNQRTPIALFLKGKDIQFQFSENSQPWQVFHMRLSDHSYQLFSIEDGKTKPFPEKKLTNAIAGSDLTYEDLSFRFFYWKNPQLESIEKVGSQECYKIRLNKPKGDAGRYEVVYVWVHTKFGAFMRIRGHNAQGKLVKEFQVEDVMKIDDNTWTLKKMQVSTFDASTERRQSITDLNFDTPKKSALRGIR